MAEFQHQKILEHFKLNEKQLTAVRERGRDVVVTAGAGSGKSIYAGGPLRQPAGRGHHPPPGCRHHLYQESRPRNALARVRGKLIELQEAAGTEEERQLWAESARMDSARIGTIHSLCSEILRAHPAEAGIDPHFEVLDEGLSAALRIQAVEDTLKLLVQGGPIPGAAGEYFHLQPFRFA